MARKISKAKTKWIITVISFVMSLIMFGAFIFGIFNKPTDTKELDLLDYGIGTIDSTTGKAVESRKSIYSKDLETVNGLEITVDDDANVTYKVAFYDEDKNFVSVTEALDDNFDVSSIPEGAKFFRLAITPNQVDGEDVKISALNMNKYAKQLEVVFTK